MHFWVIWANHAIGVSYLTRVNHIHSVIRQIVAFANFPTPMIISLYLLRLPRYSGHETTIEHLISGFNMMTSSNGSFFRVTGPREGIHRSPVFSPHNACDAGLWLFIWSAPGQTFEQTIETPVIWHIVALVILINQSWIRRLSKCLSLYGIFISVYLLRRFVPIEFIITLKQYPLNSIDWFWYIVFPNDHMLSKCVTTILQPLPSQKLYYNVMC